MHLRAVEGVLKRFQEAYENTSDPKLLSAITGAKVMRGTMELLDSNFDGAVEPLNEAARAMRTNGEMLNLATIPLLASCCDKNTVDSLRRIQDNLDRAHELDPANERILRNLERWYQLLAGQPDDELPFPRSELTVRENGIQAVVSGRM